MLAELKKIVFEWVNIFLGHCMAGFVLLNWIFNPLIIIYGLQIE